MSGADKDPELASIREAAARWTVRRDRGLSAAESIEYELWLAADERHAAAMRSADRAWARLDPIPENLARLTAAAGTRRRAFWRRATFVASALAAVLVLGLVFWSRTSTRPTPREESTAGRLQALPDGSLVQLNVGAVVVEEFTARERRVRLVRGEAHFSVTKNPARPFVVHAGNVDVRAVGTAFAVNLQSAAVEVLVTEGVVRLNSAAGDKAPIVAADNAPLVNRGQRALVALAPSSPEVAMVVTTLNGDEMGRALAWREPLIRLGGATLAEVAANFEHRTGRRVILADESLAELRLGGRFRADDIDGFASLLADALDVEVERAADGALILRRKNSTSR